MKKIIKCLPMPQPTHYKLYNLPPTFKEGARKATIIRDVIFNGRVLLKKGTTGVVIPICPMALYNLFQKHANWLQQGFLWNSEPHFGAPRLDSTWDFFHHYMKNGKKTVGSWHSHISWFDFQFND